jgi:hypothetical protein
MRKILACNKGNLAQWYGCASPEGSPLRLHRLKKTGRLELVQIVNDPPPYWFVMIRNFNQSDHGPDREALKGITTPWGNGVWRFQDFEKAKAKYEQLAELPIFIREEIYAQELLDKKSQAMRKNRESGAWRQLT